MDAGVRTRRNSHQWYWRDDHANESPADVDDTASMSSSTWRSTSRCSSAANTPSSLSDTVNDCSHSSTPTSLTDDSRSAECQRYQRSLSAVDRPFSPSRSAAEGRNRLLARRCSEFSPSDDLLDFLHQQDRGTGTDDPVSSCFEGRVGSLRRRRRSVVTPELMQMDRERATASPTAPSVTPSLSTHRCGTPDSTPRTQRRRLLPQPDRATAVELAPTGDKNKEADVPALGASSRYFVPISNHQDLPREGSTPCVRRLPLIIGSSVDRNLTSQVAEQCGRRLDETTGATSVEMSSSAKTTHPRDSVDAVSPNEVVIRPSRRQHRHQHAISTMNGSIDDNNDKLFDLPEDEEGQLSTRLTFRAATLPRRWKCPRPNADSSKLVDGRGFSSELRKTNHEAHKYSVQSVTESPNSVNCTSTSEQPTLTSGSARSRVEAMKDRFRRLSEMYKNSLDEDSAEIFATTKTPQINCADSEIENNQRLVDETDSSGTEFGSKTTSSWKTATPATASDTESQSSCGRDEGFESETATSSVHVAAKSSCPESRHAHAPTADVVTYEDSSATTETTTTCVEGNLFASSIDSIIQQMHVDSQNMVDSGLLSRRTPSTEESSGAPDSAPSTSESSRLSRIRQQRAFADRMSTPRRSATRSPQRRTPETPRNGLFSSPLNRRRMKTPAASVGDEESVSRFVRASVARTTLPHSDVASRAPAGRTSWKQSATASSSSSKRSTSRTREEQTIKTAARWCPTPTAHVDRNGVQTKPSGSTRVFSTPVRFGPTSHQTRTDAGTERTNGAENGSFTQKQTFTDGNSDRGKCQPNGRAHTEDNCPPPKVSERKSVFERLFEKSQRNRQSKSGKKNV